MCKLSLFPKLSLFWVWSSSQAYCPGMFLMGLASSAKYENFDQFGSLKTQIFSLIDFQDLQY